MKESAMGPTYNQVKKWFDGYFNAVNECMGPLETVPQIGRFLTPDLQFVMHTAPPFIKSPLSREEFLLALVHPGLKDRMTPKYYAIDLKQMVTVARIEVRFSDESSGEELTAPIQASCHYHFVVDQNDEIKIDLIEYWTESQPAEPRLFEMMVRTKDDALNALALDWLESKL